MTKKSPKNSENEDLEKDVDACDHVEKDEKETHDDDLPETNLIPGLDKPKKTTIPKTKERKQAMTKKVNLKNWIKAYSNPVITQTDGTV